jgi:lipopolysaccharide export system protein LptA
VIKKRLLILLAGAVTCVAAPPPNPADKPLTESELLKQIETFSPIKGAATPSPTTATGSATSPLLNGKPVGGDLLNSSPDRIGNPNERISPGTPGTLDPTDKKSKGPTEITALEATFDQRKNVAVFVGSVVVKDPEFNVICDQLTAFLKHEDKSAAAKAKTTPKPVTPSPTSGKATPAPRGGGLDHAIAITTSERRVIITQDKVEADGSITHGIGKADRATYDANTGDIVLYGNPDVVQGNDRCIATDPNTVMTLNRDGRMKAVGPHKTIIIDDTPKPDATNAGAATPSPARNPQ